MELIVNLLFAGLFLFIPAAAMLICKFYPTSVVAYFLERLCSDSDTWPKQVKHTSAERELRNLKVTSKEIA